jgi:pimeloyl-ACP methyl ester carboxylesterase
MPDQRGFRRPALLAVLLFAALSFACSGASGSDGPTPLPSFTPGAGTYEPGDCPFAVPLGEKAECGRLTVPAHRYDLNSAKIVLPVAVFKSHSKEPKADPIVYLEGGPGGHTIEQIPDGLFHYLVEPFLDDRDFVLFDQRGAGLAEPALDCPQMDAFDHTTLTKDMTDAEYTAGFVAAVQACRDALVLAGADPALATSSESASDLEDLRLALGYPQWNLYGISYGTRLALTYMRDYPAGIRSVILDSTYPPDSDLFAEAPSDLHRSLGKLFADCEKDPYCLNEYPGVRAKFDSLIADLAAHPKTLDISEEADIPGATFILTDDLFLGWLYSFFYQSGVLGALPDLIWQTAKGEYDYAKSIGASMLTNDNPSGISWGMYLSIECAEEAPFGSRERVAIELDRFPEIKSVFRGMGTDTYAACDVWAVPPAAGVENHVVESDIPTLVLSGDYDPITPPGWGRAVANSLDNSWYFELPGVGHGVIISEPCGEVIAHNFLTDPETDPHSDCLYTLSHPEFY